MDEIEHLDECLHHPCSVLKSAGAPVCVEKVKMLFVFSQDMCSVYKWNVKYIP